MIKSKLTLLSLLVLGSGAAFADRIVEVTVDTHTVAPGTTGYLDFQFNLGPLVTQPATVQILNFTGATYLAGTQQLTGGASGGPLPSTITLVKL